MIPKYVKIEGVKRKEFVLKMAVCASMEYFAKIYLLMSPLVSIKNKTAIPKKPRKMEIVKNGTMK